MANVAVLRPMKIVAKIAVAVSLMTAFMGVIGGLAMGGAVLQGDSPGDGLRLAFVVMPIAAIGLFVFGHLRETGSPTRAVAIYSGTVLLVAGQLLIPALF